jgi:hypothetical protein
MAVSIPTLFPGPYRNFLAGIWPHSIWLDTFIPQSMSPPLWDNTWMVAVEEEQVTCRGQAIQTNRCRSTL